MNDKKNGDQNKGDVKDDGTSNKDDGTKSHKARPSGSGPATQPVDADAPLI